MNKEVLVQNILHYCDLRNKYPTKACEESGVGKSFVSDIKRGKVPSVEKVAMLAAYLGVTTSVLLGEETAKKEPATQKDDGLSEKFTSLFRQLTPDQKELVYRTMKEMSKDK